MGYDLTALNGKISNQETGEAATYMVNQASWGRLLSLANQHGWKPKGITKAWNFNTQEYMPCEQTDDHVEEYFGNNYQMVEADDAKEIAKALFIAAEKESEHKDFILAFAKFCDDSEGFLIG